MIWGTTAAAVLLCVIVGLIWKIANLHLHLSILNQAISDMLQQPRAAEAIAEAAYDRLVREGFIKDRRGE